MRFLLLTLILIFAFSSAVKAQTGCQTGTAQTVLDANNVRALLLNNGGLFWNGETGEQAYEVPKGGGIGAIFNASLWIGGMVDSELRMAASRYGSWEFWPGPVGASLEECQKNDRIFEITASDLDRWHESGEPTPDMIDWPWHLGAPVTDGDGIQGNYNLAGGDHPKLLGEETHWWIMNDAGGEHHATDTEAIGLEVAVTAFASSLSPILSNTTFYRYNLTYKGSEPLEDAYVSLFIDADLGVGIDDYVGSDTTLGMGFTYNMDSDDDGGYGLNPPAVGAIVLDAPTTWRTVTDSRGDISLQQSNYMTSFMRPVNGGGQTQGDPTTSAAYYNYMRGRWGTGEPMTIGGTGFDYSDEETVFAFPAEPGEYWSESNIGGSPPFFIPADRRMVLSSGPFTLEPAESTTFYVAIVWSRGSDHLDSVRQLKEDAVVVKQVAPVLLVPTYTYDTGVPPEPDYAFGANDVYPNPATAQAVLEYSLPQSMRVRLEVFDVLGRRVHDSGDAVRGAGEYIARFDTSSWPAGLYTARLQLDHITTTRTFTVVK